MAGEDVYIYNFFLKSNKYSILFQLHEFPVHRQVYLSSAKKSLQQNTEMIAFRKEGYFLK